MPRLGMGRQTAPEPSTARRAPLMERQEERSPDEATAATGALIVEDDAQAGPGQMRKTEMLEALKTASCQAADAELASVGRDTRACPYVENAFARYRQRDANYIERALRKFAPEAATARSARDYIPIVSARMAEGVRHWAETGAMPELPEGMSAADLAGGGAGGLLGGLLGGVGSALGALFAMRDGRTPPATDAGAIAGSLGEGSALDSGVRSRMEGAFGHDFGKVRVHAGTEEASLASNLGARAFTVGSHVAFAQGEYRPGTVRGDVLLAHELAHTIQQNNPQPETSAVDGLEHDADSAAYGAVGRLWGVGKLADARPQKRSGLTLSRCSTNTPLERMAATREPLPAWRNRTEVQATLLPAVTELWTSTYTVDHNTAENIVRGRVPVYSGREIVASRNPDGSEMSVGRVPDPDANWVPDLANRSVTAHPPPGGAITNRDHNGQNPIIVMSRTLFDAPAEGFESMRTQTIKSLLVHEMTHAVNRDFRGLDGDSTWNHFVSEFTARWTEPRFRNYTNDQDKSDAIRNDILRGGGEVYPEIRERYRSRPEFRDLVDRYVGPPQGMRLNAAWPPA